MWVLALGWFVALAYLAVDALTEEAPILASGRMQWALETLAGVGALTLGLLPVLGASIVQHLHRRRLRHRLEKQKAKIERRLARLDERSAGRSPRPELEGAPPAPTPAGERGAGLSVAEASRE